MTYGAVYYTPPQPRRRRRITGRMLAKLLAFIAAEFVRQLLT